MDRDFWLGRWQENKIGFHRSGVNPLLQQFWPDVGVPITARVLAPLCGKSEDVRWLAQRGHEVVGVELSEIACRAFAAEQGIAFTESREPPFLVFRGDRITLYAGDLFDLTPGILPPFDLFYDRAALIAMPPRLRPSYADHLHSLLSSRAKGILISLEYDPSAMEGPPFSVAEDEVHRLFSGLDVVKRHEYDCLDDEPRFKERGLGWMKEVVYSMAC